ncbi:MAG: glycosyltransferase [Planctomycetes bacterium]|nr:glycosyltransferase [Planctomycetota bacterium]HPF14382.1 glycosyltransferase [Planctomycetota bacterium]HRV81885.1 glycosyltransferase [Planctomycetota bacterium]
MNQEPDADVAPAESAVDVTLVIPVSNPQADVESIVMAPGRVLEDLGLRWEAILVFDGIKGPAWEYALKKQNATHDQVRTIGLHRQFGAAVCLSSAFEHTLGSHVLTLPDYVQVDPDSIRQLWDAIEDGADMATGVRDQRVDPKINQWQSRLFNSTLRLLTRTPFHDLNCSVRMISATVIDQLSIYGNMYRYLPILAYRRGFRVDEVPLRHIREEAESGSRFPLSYIRRTLDILGIVFLTGFTHKPLRFFGALGGACLGLGVSLFGWALIMRMLGSVRPLMETPLFLIGLVIAVLGLQVIGFGLVGEIVVFTQARNVREYRIQKIHR